MRMKYLSGLVLSMMVSCIAAADVLERDVREAIVKIFTVHSIPDYYNPWSMRGTQQSTGSGAIIEGRLILTNGHVVRDATFVQVRRFGESRRYQARVLFTAHQADLALLTVDDPDFFEGVEPLTFGELPRTQEEVNVYGFPVGGDTLSITKGVISRIEHQTYVHSSIHLLAVQIDAAINPGNSGGPAIVDGKIVGVAMQGIPQADNIGYIVPIPVIQHFLKDIEDGGRDGIPSMGVLLQNLENPDMRRRYGMSEDQSGVLIVGIIPGSVADGVLKEDDVILALDGYEVADDGTIEFRPRERTSLSFLVQRRQVGERISLEVLRGGETQAVELELSRAMNNDWLIPFENYDELPTYYIYGGVVFVPLNRNLLRMWGGNWFNTAPKEMVAMLSSNFIREERDEVVVALKVLAADVNQGFHNESHLLIEKVDDMPVRNVRHLIELIAAGEGNEFIEFESAGRRKIILDRAKSESTLQDILAVYRIPVDRSEDLLP